MFEINLSRDSDYCTQINNKKLPYESCNTTAAIMALDASGITYPRRDGVQPEDDLTELLLTSEAWRVFRLNHSAARNAGLKPQNVSPMLAWGINKFVGHKVDNFIINGTLQQMIWLLLNGKALIMSGSFTKSGHFVTVVGFASKQHRENINNALAVDICKIDAIIVDDPYGNYYTGYGDYHGNDVRFSLQDFNHVTNESNRDGHKWMHIISEAQDES